MSIQKYFTCGPSQLYPTVKKHLKRAMELNIGSLSHRSEQFHEIFNSVQENLRQLMNIPKEHHIFFLSSSLEAMERILENCLITQSFHFVNGAFSQKFFEIASQVGKKPAKIEAEWGSGFDTEKIKIPREAELIAITQNETSTGVSLPPSLIHRLKYRYLDKLLAVDIVSSAPYADINFRLVDLAFFSVQKGFGLPPGLSVLIASPRAIERSSFIAKKGYPVGSYHSFLSLIHKEKVDETPETPNVTNLYLLTHITEDMISFGMEKIRRDTDEKAEMMYSFFERSPHFHLFVKDRKFRSATTIVIESPEATQFGRFLKGKGYVVSSGYGRFKEKHLRIANFPAHRKKDVKKLIELMSGLEV